MYYLYILISLKDRKLYIGYTNDIKLRISKHKNGFVRATKNRRPLKLIYYEAYIFKKDAKQREKYFKGGKGKKELKIQLRITLEKCRYLNL